MNEDLVVFQLLPDGTVAPRDMVTTKAVEEAAWVMDEYPNAGYHYFIARMVVEPID